MKTVSFIIFSLGFLLPVVSQNEQKLEACFEYKKQQNIFISNKPVTNGDYVTYIAWLINTQTTDYPVTLLNAISGSNDFGKNMPDSINIINYLIEKIPDSKLDHIPNYIFNPKYINYPLLGLNRKQATVFCKWLSDRHNEYFLISNGYFKYYFNQINDDVFVTESYLNDQYKPQITKDTILPIDFLGIIPTLRIPFEYEIYKTSAKLDKLKQNEPTYSFLSPWFEKYVSINKNGNYEILDFTFNQIYEIDGGENDWPDTLETFHIYTLASQSQNQNNLTIFDRFKSLNLNLGNENDPGYLDLDDGSKVFPDSLGMAPYFILTYKNDKSIVINKMDFLNQMEQIKGVDHKILFPVYSGKLVSTQE